MKKKCENCRFWESETYECRYNPPVICFDDDEAINHGAFPIIEANMWCGKWEHEDSKETK